MKTVEKEIQDALFSMQDKTYQAFQSKLMPTIAPERIIGVRSPQLRSYAKKIAKTEAGAEFLNILPHTYYEENNLHAVLLAESKDYEACIKMLDAFLPYIDNWATCDILVPRIFGKHLKELLPKILEWKESPHPYTIRFAIGMLMRFYLDDAFSEEYPQMVAQIRSQEYYVNMMIAWYFATALAKQYESVLPYLDKQTLDVWVHNKTIQKAVESFRITEEQKAYLRTLRIRK